MIKIEAFDKMNQAKRVGGDFWLARVETGSRDLYVESEIQDFRNGTVRLKSLARFRNLVVFEVF